MSKNKKKKTVAVLGGGLAGLAASFELSKNGYEVIVLEMQDDVGGLARTIEKNKFRFDTGPHRWYTKNTMVDQWMLKLMGKEIVKVPRLTRIYFDKKFFYYPIKLKNVILGIGVLKATRAVFDYFLARLTHRINPRKAETLEDGYIDKFGRTLYETFFKRYSEKLWGRSCKEVSSDWIGQRTRGFNITTILKDVLFKSSKVVSFVDEFSYPKHGIGRIAGKLAFETKKRGGKIMLNTKITGVSYDKNNVVTTIDFIQNKRQQQIKADYIISTIPLSDLVFALTPKANKEITQKAKKLLYRDQVQVILFINKTHVTPDTWIYVHPEHISFMRLMEMSNWTNELSPKGKTSIVFEISCNQGDNFWNMKDSDLIKQVSDEFIKEFSTITYKDIIGGYVHRVEKEYPVYHLGYRNDVDAIKSYLKKFTNLQIAGRNGTFRYNNMDHSIEMGLYAAWNIIAGYKKHNVDSVNIEREYLEEKKLEDIGESYAKSTKEKEQV